MEWLFVWNREPASSKEVFVPDWVVRFVRLVIFLGWKGDLAQGLVSGVFGMKEIILLLLMTGV